MAVAFGALPAHAHSADESYVWLEIFDETIEGRVEYPLPDLVEILELPIESGDLTSEATVEQYSEEILDYTRAHFGLGMDGVSLALAYDEPTAFTAEETHFAVIPFRVEGSFDPMPRVFDVTYDGIVEERTDRSALLLIATDWRSGTFNNDVEHLVVFTQNSTTATVDLGEPSTAKALIGVIGLGVEHIQIGSDHILFILALLLPAVLVFIPSLGWRPTETFGSSLWRVIKIATAFTLAHTVTLTLGGLGYVSISPAIVEPIIAISIALAALHNLKPVFFNREWLIAFGFGLFHGFGFAGLLAGLGLDRSNRLVSLLGFNLGIELGQVAIIVLLFPALYLLRRTLVYLRFMQIGSGALIAVALGWFVDRVFGLDIGVDRVVEPVLAWPRPLWISLIFTLGAWAYYRAEKARERLIPVSGMELDSDEFSLSETAER